MALSALKREYDHHTEQIHAAGGPSVRDVILGLNDGLVASFAVTSGVAGAFTSPTGVVIAGLSEMLGGAVSMGLAAFASARAQFEFYQSEVQRERKRLNAGRTASATKFVASIVRRVSAAGCSTISSSTSRRIASVGLT
jgi:VIT1/CCC1 family predicted Fe2+/Mn2+ transporter